MWKCVLLFQPRHVNALRRRRKVKDGAGGGVEERPEEESRGPAFLRRLSHYFCNTFPPFCRKPLGKFLIFGFPNV